MTPDLFIVAMFTLLAVWLAVGIFSSRLASEANCQECGEPVSYAMSKRGVSDVALCGSCGVAVGSISLMAEQSDQDGAA
jgi:ribosomal protein L34E